MSTVYYRGILHCHSYYDLSSNADEVSPCMRLVFVTRFDIDTNLQCTNSAFHQELCQQDRSVNVNLIFAMVMVREHMMSIIQIQSVKVLWCSSTVVVLDVYVLGLDTPVFVYIHGGYWQLLRFVLRLLADTLITLFYVVVVQQRAWWFHG